MEINFHHGLLVARLVSALLCIAPAADAEWRWAAPVKRRAPETIDEIIRRRGYAAPALGTNPVVRTVDPATLEVNRLKRQVEQLDQAFGEFTEIDGELIYRRGDIKILYPVRRYADEVVVLGPRTPRLWVELLDAQVLNVMTNGLLVVSGDHVLLVQNYPSASTMLAGSRLSTWVRVTVDRYRYTTVMDVNREALVADYGQFVTREEAAKAIGQLMDEWAIKTGALKARATSIQDEAAKTREERIRKFRAEQEAIRLRDGLGLSGKP